MKIRALVCVLALPAFPLCAQDGPPAGDPPPGDGPRPFGPPGMMQERKVVKDFDKDGDKRLDAAERAEAREFLKKNPTPRRGPGGPGGGGRPPGMGGRESEPTGPGARLSPGDVPRSTVKNLYAPNTLRTFFLDFENADWEAELEAFHGTDVEVPATLTVDGVKYPGVGVHFRGMSSYFMLKAGQKRSLNVAIDHTDRRLDLDGYSSLNLLNAHEDASFMGTVLYSHIARQYLPAPKANLVRVVINGESWGVYENQQQFDKNFLQENFRTQKGARWKVKGSPMGAGGLEYTGDDVAEYRKRFELKSKENADDWKALIALCKTLNETPPDQLEAALAPMLDVDGVLWFLALDNALINCDGYWIRASDYSLYRDKDGVFHVLPHDMNEAFRQPRGPGMGGGRGFGRGPRFPDGEPGPPPPDGGRPPEERGRGGFGGPEGGRGGGLAIKGVELDPLVGLDDSRKPLRSKLLAVPALRERYLAHIRTIAEEWLDWKKLGPIVAQYRALVEKEVEADTRKLTSFAAFQRATADQVEPTPEPAEPDRPGRQHMSLREFADQRRAYLLNYSAPK